MKIGLISEYYSYYIYMENRSHFRLFILYLHGKQVSFQSTIHIIFTWKIGLISEYYSYYIYMENKSHFRVLFIYLH